MININICQVLIAEHKDQFRDDFHIYIKENPHVYEAFENGALQVIRKGFNHYSARTIAEVIRHRSNIREINGEFKISNNRIPCLARLFALRYPQYKDLFTYHNTKLRMAA